MISDEQEESREEFEAAMDRVRARLWEDYFDYVRKAPSPGFFKRPLDVLPRAGELARGVYHDANRQTAPETRPLPL